MTRMMRLTITITQLSHSSQGHRREDPWELWLKLLCAADLLPAGVWVRKRMV